MTKTNLKKIMLFMLLIILSLICITACGKKEDIELSIVKNQIERFEQTVLTVDGKQPSELTYSSSDNNIATVDKNGIVTGVGTGSAKITASSGKKTGYVDITVFANTAFPVLNIKTNTLTLNKTADFNVDAFISYKNNVVVANIALLSSETSVASSSGLKLSANGVGKCVITVSASYAGEVFSRDIGLTVRENESFVLEETSLTDLYLSDPYGDDTYQTAFTLSPLAYRDGIKVDAEVSYSAYPTGILNIESGLVSGIKEGNAVITALWVSPSGNTNTSSIEISVKKPRLKGAESYDFLHGSTVTLNLDNIDFIKNVSAKLYNNDILLASANNGVFSFDSTSASVGETYLSVQSDTFIYELPTVFYTHKISTKNDWVSYAKTGFKGGAEATVAAEKMRDGYIILADSIDMGGEVFALNTYDSGTYQNASAIDAAKDRFYGVFDGRGHTIYNVKIGRQGFFGCVAEGSVIKNTAFADTEIAAEVNWFIGIFSHFMYGTVDNCYVELNYMPNINGVGGIARYLYGNVQNSVVFIKRADNTSFTSTHGAICQDVRQNGKIVNSYAVSEGEMKLNITGSSGNGAMFDSFESLNANADTTDFNTVYWKKSNFTLTFKSRYELAVSAAEAQASKLSKVYEGIEKTVNTDDFLYEATGAVKQYLNFGENKLTAKGMTDGAILTAPIHVSLKLDISVVYTANDFTAAKPMELLGQEIDLHRADSNITLTDLEIQEIVNSVELNGQTTITASGGTGSLTVAKADIEHALGRQGLIITTDSAAYLLPINVITMGIYNENDLEVYKNTYFKGGANAVANIDPMRDGYVVLKTDIDMKGKRFSLNPNAYDTKTDSSQEANAHIWRFYGVFDGGGHVIDDIKIDLYGFFGHTAANSVIRNFGLTGVTFNAGWNCGAFAEDSYGLIENCFVEIKSFPDGNNFGGFVKNLKGTLRNSIAYVSGADTTEAVANHGVIAFTLSGAGKLENVYALRSDSKLKAVANTSAPVTVYDTLGALYADGDFAEFSGYFLVTANKLQFGSKTYIF